MSDLTGFVTTKGGETGYYVAFKIKKTKSDEDDPDCASTKWQGVLDYGFRHSTDKYKDSVKSQTGFLIIRNPTSCKIRFVCRKKNTQTNEVIDLPPILETMSTYRIIVTPGKITVVKTNEADDEVYFEEYTAKCSTEIIHVSRNKF